MKNIICILGCLLLTFGSIHGAAGTTNATLTYFGGGGEPALPLGDEFYSPMPGPRDRPGDIGVTVIKRTEFRNRRAELNERITRHRKARNKYEALASPFKWTGIAAFTALLGLKYLLPSKAPDSDYVSSFPQVSPELSSRDTYGLLGAGIFGFLGYFRYKSLQKKESIRVEEYTKQCPKVITRPLPISNSLGLFRGIQLYESLIIQDDKSAFTINPKTSNATNNNGKDQKNLSVNKGRLDNVSKNGQSKPKISTMPLDIIRENGQGLLYVIPTARYKEPEHIVKTKEKQTVNPTNRYVATLKTTTRETDESDPREHLITTPVTNYIIEWHPILQDTQGPLPKEPEKHSFWYYLNPLTWRKERRLAKIGIPDLNAIVNNLHEVEELQRKQWAAARRDQQSAEAEAEADEKIANTIGVPRPGTDRSSTANSPSTASVNLNPSSSPSSTSSFSSSSSPSNSSNSSGTRSEVELKRGKDDGEGIGTDVPGSLPIPLPTSSPRPYEDHGKQDDEKRSTSTYSHSPGTSPSSSISLISSSSSLGTSGSSGSTTSIRSTSSRAIENAQHQKTKAKTKVRKKKKKMETSSTQPLTPTRSTSPTDFRTTRLARTSNLDDEWNSRN